MTTTPHQNDSFSDFMRDTLGAPGQSGLDLYAKSPGRRSVTRIFESSRMTGRETKEYAIPERWVIRSGTCVALCEDGLVRPALPEYALERIVGHVVDIVAIHVATVEMQGDGLVPVAWDSGAMDVVWVRNEGGHRAGREHAGRDVCHERRGDAICHDAAHAPVRHPPARRGRDGGG